MEFALRLLIAFVGFVGGFVGGVWFAIYCQTGIERQAMKEGFIKLCGKYYRLTKITKEDEWTVDYDE